MKTQDSSLASRISTEIHEIKDSGFSSKESQINYLKHIAFNKKVNIDFYFE